MSTERKTMGQPLPIVGVDTGGTFTDFFVPGASAPRTLKILSTPDDPGRAIRQGLAQLGLDQQPCLLIHGTTVGTNAVLEGKGAAVVYVTNRGFTDILSLGRQQRQQVYALHPKPRAEPVPAADCVAVDCRLDVAGEWLEAPSENELARLSATLARRQPVAVAINLIHGWCAADAETLLANCVPEDCFVACSSQVLPAAGEYERGIATWLQASTGPVLGRYLKQLSAALPQAQINVMQSDALSLDAAQAAQRAVHLLLSGPAGGVCAARDLARRAGLDQLLTFDMGGTSTDVALVGKEIVLTQEAQIGPWPVAVPMVDIHTIGAGGGSLANVDDGGLLQVGPASAGAEPGPACYGRGGEQVTVTDAHVVLGRIPPGARLGGHLALDRLAAVLAMQRLAEQLNLDLEAAAEGVIRLANEQMSRALRVVSADRGSDPQRCVLLSFGGAGGLHACELAQLLGIQKVLVAPHAGVLSALGMTVAQPGRRILRSVLQTLESLDFVQLEQQFQQLEQETGAELLAEGCSAEGIRHRRQLAWRYAGQKMSLVLPWRSDWSAQQWRQAFTALHQERCAYTLDQPIELAEILLSSVADARIQAHQDFVADADTSPQGVMPGPEKTRLWSDDHWLDGDWWQREQMGQNPVEGPAVISSSESTIYLPTGWRAYQDEQALLWLEKLN